MDNRRTWIIHNSDGEILVREKFNGIFGIEKNGEEDWGNIYRRPDGSFSLYYVRLRQFIDESHGWTMCGNTANFSTFEEVIQALKKPENIKGELFLS